jgi:hypothetical protein
METCPFKASTSDSFSASFALRSSTSFEATPEVEEVEGREACLAVVLAAGDPVTVDRRFFASGVAPVALVLVLVAVREPAVPAGAAVRGAVPVRDVAVFVEAAGFLKVDVVDAVAGLVVLDGDDVNPLGTTEERRAADVMVDLFFSSSDTEGCDRWLVDDAVLAGFLTVAPAGGRVGGLLRLLTRVEALVPVLAAVLVAVTGRRAVDAAVLGRFTAVEPPAFVEDAGDLVVVGVLGDSIAASPVPAVPVVSSPERIDSSFWITSDPSASDMVAARELCVKGRYRFALDGEYVFANTQWH